MNTHTRDNALSEVIGMILILAIIVMTMSVYITYTVPQKGKEGEITHMNEVRSSFLELSYLIDSLWANEKTNVSVSIPVPLHSSPEPAIVSLFTPISAQGFIEIGSGIGTCNITFFELEEQRVLNYPPVALDSVGVNTTVLREKPQNMMLRFNATISSHTPTGGVVARLNGEDPSEWQVELKVRSVLTDVARNDFSVPPSIIRYYLHSLIAVETSSKLEYVVIDNISGPVSVDLKPVLELLGTPLLHGSSLFFSSSDSLLPYETSPSLTISYPSRPSSHHTVSTETPLTDLMFSSSNYYWIDQQYRYHKGGVFLRQEGNSTALADIPLHIENRSDSLAVSIVDIEIHPKNNRVRSSGGRAQVIAEVQKIQNQLCNETGCYDTSDAIADSVMFTIMSPHEDTVHMWEDIFRRACATVESACELNVNTGQATLMVSSEKPIAVQYTKIDVDLEIRV